MKTKARSPQTDGAELSSQELGLLQASLPQTDHSRCRSIYIITPTRLNSVSNTPMGSPAVSVRESVRESANNLAETYSDSRTKL